MNVDFETSITPEIGMDAVVLPDLPRNWDFRLARLVSNVINPIPVIAVILLVLAGMTHAWKWAAVYIVGAIVLPGAYIFWLLRRGIVSDFNVRNREERMNPMIFTVVTTVLSWLGLKLGGAPDEMVELAFVGIFITVLLLLITLYWKISIHTTAISALSIFLGTLFGWLASPALLMIPLVAWARVRTNSHTLRQTIGGAVAGACFMLVVHSLSAI